MVGLPAGNGPEAFFSYAVKGSRACLLSSGLFFYRGPYVDYWNQASGKKRLQAEQGQEELVPRHREVETDSHTDSRGAILDTHSPAQ